jgi:recombination protein RecT
MSAVTNAVAKTENGIESVITTYKPRLDAILPDHINVDQFAGLAMGALYRDSKLREAANTSPGSFMNALMRCASLGHQPGTEEFYLIPRKNKGKPEVQGIEGYRGIVERMYRSGAVASVVVREVCQFDQFEYIEGEHDKPQHKVDWFGGNRGPMIGVYAYAQLTTGAVSRVVILSKDDVMAAKAKSDGSDSSYSPWNRLDGGPDHPEFTGRSMWWKTAARRLEPWVPTSAEYRREQLRAAVEADNLRRTAPAAERAPDMDPASEYVDAEVVDEGGER